MKAAAGCRSPRVCAHLTLCRAALYAAVLSSASAAPAQSRSSSAIFSPAPGCGVSPACGPALSAQSNLDEAWEIAARGPMPLFLADIHLYRARLFGSEKAEGGMKTYPWESPQHDLAEARRLIVKHGYGRRMPELEDAEAALPDKQTGTL